MGTTILLQRIPFLVLVLLSALHQSSADGLEANQTVSLSVYAAEASAKKIPETLFGIFFEVRLFNNHELFIKNLLNLFFQFGN